MQVPDPAGDSGSRNLVRSLRIASKARNILIPENTNHWGGAFLKYIAVRYESAAGEKFLGFGVSKTPKHS